MQMNVRSFLTLKTTKISESGLIKGGWLIVTLLCVAGGLNYLDRLMITTMRTSIIGAIPMSDTQFGLLTSSFLWVYALFSPFAGFFADRFGRSLVIIVSLFAWSAVTWLTAYSTTFGELLTTRILLGITQACYIPASVTLITDYHLKTTRSLAGGVHEAGIMIGAALAFLGGLIAETQHWNTAFIIFGLTGIIFSIVLVFLLRDVPEKENMSEKEITDSKVNFMAAIKDLFRRRSFLFMAGYWGLIAIVGWFVIGWLPTYYKEQFNLSQGTAGLYATGYLYPASIVGVLLGGFLADQWSRTNQLGRIYVPVIGLCIAAPCIFIATYTTILPLAIGFFMIYSVTRVFGDANIMAIMCMVADSRYRATGMGILNFFACIIGGIGIYAGGALRDLDINLKEIYPFAALAIVICALLLFMVKPQAEYRGK
jgi:MFS family permease